MKIQRSIDRASVCAALAALSLAALLLALHGCETGPSLGPRHQSSFSGALISHSGCKNLRAALGAEGPGKDCLVFTFSDGTLLVDHLNAAFNCCPDSLGADIRVSNDTVYVLEIESMSMPCACLCLYDLHYAFENLPSDTMTFLFIEPYAWQLETDPALIATIEPAAADGDTVCVRRDHYPWTTGGSGSAPSGRLIGISECGGSLRAIAEEPWPADMSCIEYRYFGGGTLRLTHRRAAFNCCGERTAEVTVSGSTITITEGETGAFCDCACLYDLDFEIANLPAGDYSIVVNELYLHEGDERLSFSVDLVEKPAGVRCADRTGYPWSGPLTLAEDLARLRGMRGRIQEFIGTPYCGGEGDCRYIAFGAKPCGGPWEYLIYSAATVDPAVLGRLVDRYNAVNAVVNRRHDLASTCDVPSEPNPGCIGSVCRDLN